MILFWVILDVILWVISLILYMNGHHLAASIVAAAAIGVLSGLTGADIDIF